MSAVLEFAWRDGVKRRTLSVTIWLTAVPHYTVWPAEDGVGLFRSWLQFSVYFSCWDAQLSELNVTPTSFLQSYVIPARQVSSRISFLLFIAQPQFVEDVDCVMSIPLFTFYRFLRLATPSFELRQIVFLEGSKTSLKSCNSIFIPYQCSK